MATTLGKVVKVLVPIGEGSEEMETVGITDTLTRFGANVVTASVTGDKTVKMSRGLEIMTNIEIREAEHKKWDLIVCPGGMKGALCLKESEILIRMLRLHHIEKGLIGAICAAPAIVLPEAAIDVNGSTCYPSKLLRDIIPNVSNQDIVVHENIVTAAGPGIAIMFALTLGKLLFGQQKATEIARDLLVYRDARDNHGYNITDTTRGYHGSHYVPAECTHVKKIITVNPDIFVEIIWPKLKERGFMMETKDGTNDTYYFPPGINVTNGRLGRDYFDSPLSVLRFLQADLQFGHFFKLYSTCVQVYEIEKSANALPEKFSREWLEEMVVITYPSFQSLYSIGI